MAITSMDSLVNAIASYKPIPFLYASLSNMAAGVLASLYTASRQPPQGSTPSSPVTLTSSDPGCISIPGGSGTVYLAGLSYGGTVAGSLILVDRLAHMGGLSGTVTTSQTVNLSISTAASQNRCSQSGSDVLWGLEWYTDTGSTAVTATVSYTNQNDVSGRTTTVSLAATRRAGMFLPIIPAAGDTIKSVQSVTLSASTGTAGNFGVTAVRIIRTFPIPLANVGFNADFADTGLAKIESTSFLTFLFLNSTTSTGVITGDIILVVG